MQPIFKMSKFKEKGQKNNILDISNDDFESPVVFKKFKPSNNNTHTKRIKQKKSNNKKQLTLHQVYNENFRFSDMNSEHLQMALALSRSTTEMFNDHHEKEEFPLNSLKEGKKKTLLEFGFKINKPKMDVDHKILKKEPLKVNKKSKFRFITPILMMRTDEERESLIQSKLSSIFGQNNNSCHYENSIPEVSSKQLEKIRCRDCSIFYLNGQGISPKEKDFIIPHLNIEGMRARAGVLLKDWKKIPLRDHTPSRSKIKISHMIGKTDILDSTIENSTVSSEILIPRNNSEKDQSSHNNSNVFTNRFDLNLDILQSEENFEKDKSPKNCKLPIDYRYGAVSPDLFDTDISFSSNSPQVKKNLNRIFSQKEIIFESEASKPMANIICQSNNIYSSGKEGELNSEKINYRDKEVFFVEDLQTSRKKFSCSESTKYHFSEDEKFSDSFNERKESFLKTGNIKKINGVNSEQIILSSDEEYSNEEKLCDILEIRKLHEKYLNNSPVDNSYRKKTNSTESDFSRNQNLSERKLSDSFSYMDSIKIDNLYETTRNCQRKNSRKSNELIRNNKLGNEIYCNSDDEICDTEITGEEDEHSSNNLKVEKSIEKLLNYSNISKVDLSPGTSSFSVRPNLSGSHKSDPFGKQQLNNKHFSNDDEIDYLNEMCIDNSKKHFPDKLEKVVSDSLSGSLLDSVLEKHSYTKKKISKSKEIKSPNNLVRELKERNDSLENDSDKRKYFLDNESISSSTKSYFDDVDLKEIEEISTIRQHTERDHFLIDFRNNDNTSMINLENTPDQKLKKTSLTPLRRYTSFNENGTPKKNTNFTRHKSESHITPSRKFIIKTQNVTPMVDYDTFSTPDIVQELGKFGLKPLKRKRGINLLKHIYETTHPILQSHQGVLEEMPVEKRMKGDAENVDNLGIIESQMTTKEFKVMKEWSESILESDAILERQRSSKISTCQVPLQIVWYNFLNKNPDILQNVLLYEPLQVEVIHKMFKELGYKFHIQDLIAFFDQKCITIRVAQGHQGKG